MCPVRFLLEHGMWSTWQPYVSQRSPHLSVTCWSLHLFRPTTPSPSTQQRSHDCLPEPSICSSSSSLRWIKILVFLLSVSPTHWSLWLASPPDSVLVSWSSLPCWPTWWHLTPRPGCHHPHDCSVVLIIWSCRWANLPFVAHSDLFFTFIHANTQHICLEALAFSTHQIRSFSVLISCW